MSSSTFTGKERRVHSYAQTAFRTAYARDASCFVEAPCHFHLGVSAKYYYAVLHIQYDMRVEGMIATPPSAVVAHRMSRRERNGLTTGTRRRLLPSYAAGKHIQTPALPFERTARCDVEKIQTRWLTSNVLYAAVCTIQRSVKV